MQGGCKTTMSDERKPLIITGRDELLEYAG